MPHIPSPDPAWLRLAACVALELTLVFAVAGLIARRLRPGSPQRTLWRLSFVTAGTLLAAELAGLGQLAVPWLGTAPPAIAKQQTATVSVTLLPPSAGQRTPDPTLETGLARGGNADSVFPWPGCSGLESDVSSPRRRSLQWAAGIS